MADEIEEDVEGASQAARLAQVAAIEKLLAALRERPDGAARPERFRKTF